MQTIDTIIFDLGGVLIDWNPKYLFRDVFNGDEEKVDWFLNTICTSEWNEAHDAGRPLKEGTALLVDQFPEYESWIRMYYDRWPEMLGGAIADTVAILNRIKQLDAYRLYALTNWSAETFPVALKRYGFLGYFDGIVVSGEEKTRKPFKKIYGITIKRYDLNPEKTIFIDDNINNVEVASTFGIHGIHFRNAKQLSTALRKMNVAV